MRPALLAAVILGSTIAFAAGPTLALRNDRVRAWRTTADATAGIDHGPGAIISLDDGDAGPAGTAVWVDDVAAPGAAGRIRGAVAIVQPMASPPRPPEAAVGSRPGEATFTGMSFKTLFENDRVTLIRARMDVGAKEAFHTHASDTVVVHLSGGAIEDTANGKTTVNRWKRGEVEFESKGSSHSARNAGGAVDVVLVALKP
jgi:quercetin dioxygenase-like cupin family protein